MSLVDQNGRSEILQRCAHRFEGCNLVSLAAPGVPPGGEIMQIGTNAVRVKDA
jgi:hypothetical protein